MPFISRSETLRRLRSQVAAGRPLLGAGAGTGISAKFAERGGVDLIIIYNSGRYRMAGRGSMAGVLAYGDANAIVDPFRLMPVFLRQLKEMGFDGVQNFPTIGLFDGRIRTYCEETGFGYGLEVDMIREAHALDMLTCPYVFDEDEARAMTEAGADVLVPHMGTTVKGAIGAQTAMSLDEAARRVQSIRDAAIKIRPDILVLCHGGPIAEPEDAQYIFDHTEGIAGFFGASSIERLSVEPAIEAQTRSFKELSPSKGLS
jgi:predicted TIM-barrel enzyme